MVLVIVVSLFYTSWMIRRIGILDYGLYSLVGTSLSYYILDFGLAGTSARFVVKYRVDVDEQKVANMPGLTAKVYLVLDSIIFAVVFILYFFLTDIFGGGLTPEKLEKLKVFYCIAGTLSVISFLFKPVSGAMMAYEYFVENKSFDILVRVGTVAFIFILLLHGGNAITASYSYLLYGTNDGECAKKNINRETFMTLSAHQSFLYRVVTYIYKQVVEKDMFTYVEHHTPAIIDELGIPMCFSKVSHSNVKITEKVDVDIFLGYQFVKKSKE